MTDPKSKFRSIKEVERYLDEVRQQLREDMEMAEKSAKQLQSMSRKAVKATEFILDISGDGKPGKKAKKKTINVDFPVVKVPNKDQLTKNYRIAESLTEQFKELEAQENEVRMLFRGNSKADKLLGEFSKLKGDLQKQLKTLFSELNNVAEGHAPKEYKDFVKELADELNDNQYIDCDSINNFTYVAVDKEGELVFAGYIVLNNAVSDEGSEIPHLYIAVKWTVGGDVEVFVDHDFIQPGLLRGGHTVENVNDAAKAITQQLSLEGFSSQIGNLPVNMQIRAPGGELTKDAFTAAPFITKLESAGDRLRFTVSPEGKSEIAKIKTQLFMEVKQMLRKKRGTTVKMATEGNEIVFTFSNLDSSNGIHPVDLEWLEEKYKLSQSQLRRIANEINNG